jgi:hypothetical protein
MTVALLKTAFASTGAQSVSLSSILSVSNDGNDPAYLVVNGLDRNEYTTTSTGKLGTLTGNGATAGYTGADGDGRGLGIVFTWNAATGSYVNSAYGNLLNLTVNTSSSPNELADLSFYSCSSQAYVTGYGAYLNDASAMCQLSNTASSPFLYLGSASFATQSIGAPSAATQPLQATPDSICATAMNFVGDTWNLDGCWVLASTIDAEAGAALPVSSSFAEIPGQASGEWKIAYNGPVSASANWQSLVQAGDQVALITAGGSGHITTVVSGYGTNAQLVDNIDYGTNLAHDGNANDLIIAGPHSVSQEFPGANPATVVIYRLDTPTITVATASITVSAFSQIAFANLFSASDWAGTAITAFQAYDTSATGGLIVNGVTCTTDTAAAACATASSLSNLGFFAGSTAGAGALYVRALNADGYWGDWRSTALTIGGDMPALAAQTAAQTVYGGQTLSFSAAGAFTDPGHQTLTYAAALSSGAALPNWLSFNTTSGLFTGTAPATAQTVSVKLTATNTDGNSASETFTITDKTAPSPLLVAQTAAQTIYGGQAMNLSAASAFRDPSGESLTYAATLSSGAALPSWLSFNTATGAFSGTAPNTAQTLTIKLTATNAGGSSTSETFTIADKSAPAPLVVTQTPAQTVYAGGSVSVSTAGTFRDPSGEALTLKATLASGAALPSWLNFNAATGIFSGAAPATAQTLSVKLTATNAGGTSSSETFTVTDKLDVPVLAKQIAAQTVYAGSSFSISTVGAFTDPAGAALTEKATLSTGAALPSWLSFNAATGSLTGTAPTTAQTTTVKLTATTASGGSVSETITLTDKLDVPVLAKQTAAQTVYGGQVVNVSAAGAFSDPTGAALTLKATLTSGAALPSWLSFNAATGSLTGTAPTTAQVVSVKVAATNASGGTASETITITDKLDVPVAAVTPSLIIYAGSSFSLSVAGAYTDPTGAAFTEKAILSTGAALPSWLSFNASTGVFSGTAPTTAQAVSIKLTATNAGGASTSETITLTDRLDVPLVAKLTAAQTVYAGRAVSVSVAGAFSDPAGATLTEKATLSTGAALPSWLGFNGTTGQFSGTAPITPQTLGLKVTASNAAGQSASETFSMFIKAAPATGAITVANPLQVGGLVLTAATGGALSDGLIGIGANRELLRPQFSSVTGLLPGQQPVAGPATLGEDFPAGSALMYPAWTTTTPSLLAMHS